MIIVGESDGTGGCICCSGGMGDYVKKDPSYNAIRSVLNECGRLHREITERFGHDEVEIIQIEPRAYVYLIPKVLKDVVTFRRSLLPSIRTMLLWYPVPIVIVNGNAMGTGRVPMIEEVIRELPRS